VRDSTTNRPRRQVLQQSFRVNPSLRWGRPIGQLIGRVLRPAFYSPLLPSPRAPCHAAVHVADVYQHAVLCPWQKTAQPTSGAPLSQIHPAISQKISQMCHLDNWTLPCYTVVDGIRTGTPSPASRHRFCSLQKSAGNSVSCRRLRSCRRAPGGDSFGRRVPAGLSCLAVQGAHLQKRWNNRG
jgi:hypothetical protein